jgi:hypothetical protein
MRFRIILPLITVVGGVLGVVQTTRAQEAVTCTITEIKQCYQSPPVYNHCCPQPKGKNEYDLRAPAPAPELSRLEPAAPARDGTRDPKAMLVALWNRIRLDLMRPR